MAAASPHETTPIKVKKRDNKARRRIRVPEIADGPNTLVDSSNQLRELREESLMQALRYVYTAFGLQVPGDPRVIADLNTGLVTNGYPPLQYPIHKFELNIQDYVNILVLVVLKQALRQYTLRQIISLEELFRKNHHNCTIPCEKPMCIIYAHPQKGPGDLSRYNIELKRVEPQITITIQNNNTGTKISLVFNDTQAGPLFNSILPEGHKSSPGDSNFWRIEETIRLLKTHPDAQDKYIKKFTSDLERNALDPTRVEENRRINAIDRITSLLGNNYTEKYDREKFNRMLHETLEFINNRLLSKPNSHQLRIAKRLLEEHIHNQATVTSNLESIIKATMAVNYAKQTIKTIDEEIAADEKYRRERQEQDMRELSRNCRNFSHYLLENRSYRQMNNPAHNELKSIDPEADSIPLEEKVTKALDEIRERIATAIKNRKEQITFEPPTILTIHPESPYLEEFNLATAALNSCQKALRKAKEQSAVSLGGYAAALATAASNSELPLNEKFKLYTTNYFAMLQVPTHFPQLCNKISEHEQRCKEIIDKHIKDQQGACDKLHSLIQDAHKIHTESNEFYNSAGISGIVAEDFPAMQVLQNLYNLQQQIENAKNTCQRDEPLISKDTNYNFNSDALVEQMNLVKTQYDELRPIINFLKLLKEQKQLLTNTPVPESLQRIKNNMCNIFDSAEQYVIQHFQDTNVIKSAVETITANLSEHLKSAASTYNERELYVITKVLNTIISALQSFACGIRNLFSQVEPENNLVSADIGKINRNIFFGTRDLQPLLNNSASIAQDLLVHATPAA